MEGRRLRDRDAIALDLVGVAGLAAFLVGLTWLQTSKQLGFDLGAALEGVVGQLATTFPAALLVLGASALEMATGLVLARLARRTPFDSIAEALIAAMVAAVLKDTILLGVLGAVGLFRAPFLVGIDALILVAALWAPQLAARTRPVTAFGGWRDAWNSFGSSPLAALVAIVWAGPVVLQLASPVVPFIDVLPNYVAPVEHLRTFGWFSPLTETQSPIIGPSRTVLGYDGLLGAIATITGLPGGLAIAGFILPETILVAAGVQRLATSLRGGDPPVGPWALLAFALTQPFARLADARGTVVVFPLVCFGLALAAELNHRPGSEPNPAPPADPWRIGRGVVIGLALGAATLVHPVIGFFAVVTLGIVGLLRPKQLAPGIVVAGVTAGLITLPQLGTMAGLSLPTLALGIGLPLAIAIGIGVGRAVERNQQLRNALIRLAERGRRSLAVVAAVLVVGAFAASLLRLDKLPEAAGTAVVIAVESSGLLLVILVIGAVLGSRGARSPLVVIGLAVGTAAVGLVTVLPNDLGLLGDALRFEVPKTVHYWLSAIAAAGAAPALAFLWSRPALPRPGRLGLVAVFVLVAALPLRLGNSGDDSKCQTDCAAINTYHLGEHRWSETFAIDLHYAASGFWVGFPDSRLVVDSSRREILDALRAEIDAGRLAHDTPVLHLAGSFQQWIATPLGALDGIDETFVSLDPEVGHQTVGGRLYGLDRLPGFLGSHKFAYIVLEPEGLPDGIRDQVIAAGYAPIFANNQGEVFGRT
jgi:hypothetical protein